MVAELRLVPPTPAIIGTTSGPVLTGAQLFQTKSCLNCHLIKGYGGRRGPDLSPHGDQLTKENITSRIVNGGVNMPAFARCSPKKIDDLVAFLASPRGCSQSQSSDSDS